MRRVPGASAIIWLAIYVCAAPGLAQEKVQFPEPRSIPQDLQLDGANLQAQRADLVARRTALVAAVQSHTAKCSSVETGPPLESECRQSQAVLVGRLRKANKDLSSVRPQTATN
jgi:hypothetical protein